MLNLLKNGEVIRQIRTGSTLNIPEAKIYLSPASAPWSYGDYSLEEYIPPEPEPEPAPTPEEIRANMPDLTSRRFWLAANSVGITEDELLLAAGDDEFLRIEIRKTTNFSRMSPSVIMLADIMDIPPEQLDTLWMWAQDI